MPWFFDKVSTEDIYSATGIQFMPSTPSSSWLPSA